MRGGIHWGFPPRKGVTRLSASLVDCLDRRVLRVEVLWLTQGQVDAWSLEEEYHERRQGLEDGS